MFAKCAKWLAAEGLKLHLHQHKGRHTKVIHELFSLKLLQFSKEFVHLEMIACMLQHMTKLVGKILPLFL